MSQAVDRGAPHPPASNQRRSGTVAAMLSFIFPGLGQAYLGRKREALIFAVPVLALFFVAIAWAVSTGLTRAGAKLLDPNAAGLAAIVSAFVVVWWAAAVITAWRAGYHSSPATVAVPVALVAILFIARVYDRVPLGASWLYSISVADHGFDGGLDCTIQDCNTGDGLPTPTNGTVAQIPTGSPQGSVTLGPTAPPTPTSTDLSATSRSRASRREMRASARAGRPRTSPRAAACPPWTSRMTTRRRRTGSSSWPWCR